MSKARITSTSQSIKDDYMQGGDILNILDQLMENEQFKEKINQMRHNRQISTRIIQMESLNGGNNATVEMSTIKKEVVECIYFVPRDKKLKILQDQSVKIYGTFTDPPWSECLPCEWDPQQELFFIKLNWSLEKDLTFKFLVDETNHMTSAIYEECQDAHGNINNVIKSIDNNLLDLKHEMKNIVHEMIESTPKRGVSRNEYLNYNNLKVMQVDKKESMTDDINMQQVHPLVTDQSSLQEQSRFFNMSQIPGHFMSKTQMIDKSSVFESQTEEYSGPQHLQDAFSKIMDVQQENSQLKELNRKQQQILELKEKELEKFKMEYSILKNEKLRLSAEHEKLKQNVSNLTIQISDSSLNVSEKQRELNNLAKIHKSQLLHEQAKFQALLETQAHMEKEKIEKLREQIKKLQEENSSLKESNEATTLKLKEVQQEQDLVMQTYITCQQKLMQMKEDFTALEQSLKEKDDQISKLQGNINGNKDQQDQKYKVEISMLQAKLKEKEVQKEINFQLTKQLDNATNQIKECNQTIAKLKQQLKKVKDKSNDSKHFSNNQSSLIMNSSGMIGGTNPCTANHSRQGSLMNTRTSPSPCGFRYHHNTERSSPRQKETMKSLKGKKSRKSTPTRVIKIDLSQIEQQSVSRNLQTPSPELMVQGCKTSPAESSGCNTSPRRSKVKTGKVMLTGAKTAMVDKRKRSKFQKPRYSIDNTSSEEDYFMFKSKTTHKGIQPFQSGRKNTADEKKKPAISEKQIDQMKLIISDLQQELFDRQLEYNMQQDNTQNLLMQIQELDKRIKDKESNLSQTLQENEKQTIRINDGQFEIQQLKSMIEKQKQQSKTKIDQFSFLLNESEAQNQSYQLIIKNLENQLMKLQGPEFQKKDSEKRLKLDEVAPIQMFDSKLRQSVITSSLEIMLEQDNEEQFNPVCPSEYDCLSTLIHNLKIIFSKWADFDWASSEVIIVMCNNASDLDRVIPFKIEANELILKDTNKDECVQIAQFYREGNQIYVKLPILDQSQDEMLPILNYLILQRVVNLAQKVKLLLAFSYTEDTEIFGQDLKQQILFARNMCGPEIANLTDSIQPIIICCDQDQGNLQEGIQNQVSILQIKTAIRNEDIEEYETKRDFIEKLGEKIEIIKIKDDRNFGHYQQEYSNNNDTTINIKSIERILGKMSSIQSKELNIPISSPLMTRLNQLFEQEYEKCTNISLQLITQAKKDGKNFLMESQNINGSNLNNLKSKISIKSEVHSYSQITTFQSNLEFLRQHQLLSDIEDRMEKFEDYLSNSLKLIERAKEYQSMSKDEQFVFDSIQTMFKQLNLKQFDKLVLTMIELYEMAGRLEGSFVNDMQEQAMIDFNRLKAERAIEDVIKCLSKDQRQILCLGYQLRKHDVNNKYTNCFLNGQVKPAILLDIIMANSWDPVAKQMKIDETKPFVMVDGLWRSLTYSINESCQESAPYVRKSDDAGKNEDLDKTSTQLYFLLVPTGGLQILKQNRMSNLGVSTKGSTICSKRTCSISWNKVDYTRAAAVANDNNWSSTESLKASFNQQQKHDENLIWHLSAIDQRNNDSWFHVQLGYGSKKPRLMPLKEDASGQSELVASTRDKDGYAVPHRSMWRILKQN